MNYRIFPPEELIEATVQLPLSKSMSNRALMIAALTDGAELPDHIAACHDTDAMIRALEDDSATTVDVGAAGTAMRFLTAYYAVSQGRAVTITGSERMLRRPIGPLVDALTQLGASIEYLGEEGFPPLRITGRRLAGGTITMDASVSSQFISALLMIAPLMDSGLRIDLRGDVTSRPYIDMTLDMMRQAGIESEFMADTITVNPGAYCATSLPVEPDWSAASYWLEIAALSSGFIDLKGMPERSLQGDSRITSLMEVTGLRTEYDDETDALQLLPTPDPGARLYTDMSGTPDLVQTMAVTCCMLQIPFKFTGVRSLRIKETDRLEALSRELLRLGFLLVIEGDDELRWDGVRFPIDEIPAFDTYQDHRMAMAFAPVSIFYPGIVINDAEVVSKSYPGFWDDLRAAGFTIESISESQA